MCYDDFKFVEGVNTSTLEWNTYVIESVGFSLAPVERWIEWIQPYNQPYWVWDAEPLSKTGSLEKCHSVRLWNCRPISDMEELKTREAQLAAVHKKGYILRYIANPDREIQKAAIENFPFAIEYVKNPDKELQMAAVTRDGEAIKHIENPDVDVQIAAVTQAPVAIDFILNPDARALAECKTDQFIWHLSDGYLPRMKLWMVEIDGLNIRHIRRPSPEVQIAAVKQNKDAIRYIFNPCPEVIALQERPVSA
ncbi:unnamed protein product [Sphagnum balticum]